MIERLVAIRAVGDESIAAFRAAMATDSAWTRNVLDAMRGAFDEAVLVATCERCELYAIRPRVGDRATPIAAGDAAFGSALLPGRTEMLSGAAAAEHLLRVAAGLDSRMLGETHVLGQVAAALVRAEEAEAAGAGLRTLFAAARRAGKRVRRETELGRLAASYVTATVERLLGSVGDDRQAVVGVLGSGAVASELIRELACRRAAVAEASWPIDAAVGPPAIRVFTRHPERLLGDFDPAAVEVVALELLPEHLPALAALVAATSSPRTLVHRAQVEDRALPLLLIDLGMPPNVDLAIADVVGVSALWLSDLSGPQPARNALAQAAAIVEHELRLVVARLARSASRGATVQASPVGAASGGAA